MNYDNKTSKINNLNFIKNLTSKSKVVILFFYDELSSDCIKMIPNILRLSKKFPGVKVLLIESEYTNICDYYNVNNFPYFIIIVNDNITKRYITKNDLFSLNNDIKNYLI
jgi:thiol-disulfide isomerase/thioredoxin